MNNLGMFIPDDDRVFETTQNGVPIKVKKISAFGGITVIIETGAMIYNVSYLPALDDEPEYISVEVKRDNSLNEYEGDAITNNSDCATFFQQCCMYVDVTM